MLAYKSFDGTIANNVMSHNVGGLNIDRCRVPIKDDSGSKGRWPANLVHDGSDEVMEMFSKYGNHKGTPHSARSKGNGPSKHINLGGGQINCTYDDDGLVSRYFYCAHASRKERTMNGRINNNHITVKPIRLMKYLCRLITPLDGLILDPFTGSGSTGVAARIERFRFVGMEINPEYCKIAEDRIRCYKENL